MELILIDFDEYENPQPTDCNEVAKAVGPDSPNCLLSKVSCGDNLNATTQAQFSYLQQLTSAPLDSQLPRSPQPLAQSLSPSSPPTASPQTITLACLTDRQQQKRPLYSLDPLADSADQRPIVLHKYLDHIGHRQHLGWLPEPRCPAL
ncbi:hypothetical protein H4R34_001121 [Dimargaris verticillata]|uniref:Uncharacterized protein n=1 Tax=Dimargaris verticillata TaxID=2761393 RepID=A0A9W8BAK9_9FUNG|nr:hypothetical protein H4R34_001121 [Dimargaris verticillata]